MSTDQHLHNKIDALEDEARELRPAAEAYSIACEELEQWQARRAKAGLEVGCTGSLCDGMAWLYLYIEQLEAALLRATVAPVVLPTPPKREPIAWIERDDLPRLARGFQAKAYGAGPGRFFSTRLHLPVFGE